MSAPLRVVREEPRSVDGRTPPHDLNAEAAVLCVIVGGESARLAEIGFLEPEHFYSEAHRRIFEACFALGAGGGGEFDVVQVASWLRDRGRLEQVGGKEYLTELLLAAPIRARLPAYAQIVHDKWRARRLIAICQRTAAQGYVDYGDIEEYIGSALEQIEPLARAGAGTALESNLETLKRIVRQIVEARASNGVTGLPTGLRGYDQVTAGLHGTQLTIFGARPGVGKTAIGMQCAVNVAACGVGVHVFSMEMKREELLMRALSARSGVDASAIRAARLTPTDFQRLTEASRWLAELPLTIDDESSLNARQIVARATQQIELAARRKRPIGLVVIDYLQWIEPTPETAKLDPRHQISQAAKLIKGFAKSAGIPVIALAQLNRELEKGGNKIRWPRVSDLAECGALERHADNIALIHREARIVEDREEFEDDGKAVLIVGKARGGKRAVVPLFFDGGTTTFRDREPLYAGGHDQ